jgi:hypothetical protein
MPYAGQREMKRFGITNRTNAMEIEQITFRRKGATQVEHGYRLEYDEPDKGKVEWEDLVGITVALSDIEEWTFGWLDSFEGLRPTWKSQQR